MIKNIDLFHDIYIFFEMYLYLCSEIQWHIYEDN